MMAGVRGQGSASSKVSIHRRGIWLGTNLLYRDYSLRLTPGSLQQT